MEKIRRKDGYKYREKIYIRGIEYKSPLFILKTDAKNWKIKMLAEKSKNGGFIGNKPQRIIFKDFALDWLENKVAVHSSRRTYENYRNMLTNHILPLVGKFYLEDISRYHADKLLRRLKQKGHNNKGINLVLGVMKRVFNEAVLKEMIVKNPLQNYKNLKLPPREEIFLSKQEIETFLKANLNDDLYSFYLVALNTGMRRGELAGLLWDKVDLDRRQIDIFRTRDKYGIKNTTKNHKRRLVPMNKEVFRLLIKLKENAKQNFVFVNRSHIPIEVNHVYRYFRNALKRANINRKIRFHDLRHTFASQFMMAGGNIYDLQKILGHSSLEMTMRYAHLAPDHLKRAAEIISFSGEEKTVRPYLGHTGLKLVRG